MPDAGPAPEVGAYLAKQPAPVRRALEDLRRVIRSAAPDAVETISYGVPAFKYRGRPLVSYGAGKTHCAFYVQSPTVMEAHRAAIEPHDSATGTIRFTPDAALPDDLVRTLVAARIAETDARRPARRGRPL